MSLDLDPKEVLQHLHSLGYCNISPELLKEFMRDLKKLIKYDQKKGLINRQKPEVHHCCHQDKHSEMETDVNYGEEEDHHEPPRTYRRSSSSRHPQISEYCDGDSTDGSDLSLEQSRCSDERIQETTRKENIPPRPPSSFIRPNNIGGKYKPKSDPVALYHYYQSLWSQNPLPGEDPRSRLRWNIRHQMMGKQKPLPTLPRAVSEEKLRNRPEWQS